MQIRTTYEVVNDVFFVKVETLNYSANDVDLMSKFGEPTVDAGGTFDYNTNKQFVLTSKMCYILKSFPITQSFDATSVPDAEDKADAWGAEMVVRITAAVTNLRALSDDFTRQESTTV
jgi:hypothetical protein